MRVVADTNVVVSGLLWQGPSRRVLDTDRIYERTEAEDVSGDASRRRRSRSAAAEAKA
jgi:hypothetical protein